MKEGGRERRTVDMRGRVEGGWEGWEWEMRGGIEDEVMKGKGGEKKEEKCLKDTC